MYEAVGVCVYTHMCAKMYISRDDDLSVGVIDYTPFFPQQNIGEEKQRHNRKPIEILFLATKSLVLYLPWTSIDVRV